MWQDMVELFATYGIWGLMVMAFAESSFFPVPPDLLMVPLSLARPDQALLYALACTVSSVVGGYFGYVLGRVLGQPLLQRLASRETLARVETMFARYGGWAIVVAALTPIPYKVFTIASGCFSMRLAPFILASLVGRGMRFFTEAVLIMVIGPRAVQFISSNFEWLTIVMALALMGLYLVYRWARAGKLPLAEDMGRRWALTMGRMKVVGSLTRKRAGEWLAALGIGGFLAFFLADVVEDVWERQLHHTDVIAGGWIESWAGPGWENWNYLFNELVLVVLLLVRCLFWWRQGHYTGIKYLFVSLAGSTAVLLGFASIVNGMTSAYAGYIPGPFLPAVAETFWAGLVIWGLMVYPPAVFSGRIVPAATGLLVLALLTIVRVVGGYMVSDVLIGYAIAGLWSVAIWVLRLSRGSEHR